MPCSRDARCLPAHPTACGVAHARPGSSVGLGQNSYKKLQPVSRASSKKLSNTDMNCFFSKTTDKGNSYCQVHLLGAKMKV